MRARPGLAFEKDMQRFFAGEDLLPVGYNLSVRIPLMQNGAVKRRAPESEFDPEMLKPTAPVSWATATAGNRKAAEADPNHHVGPGDVTAPTDHHAGRAADAIGSRRFAELACRHCWVPGVRAWPQALCW